MKCSAAAMPAPWHVRGTLTPPALPADSFSLEIRGGNFSFQPWSHHAFVQKYFLQDQAPSHYPFPGRESTHAVDLAADPKPNHPRLFQVSMLTWGAALTSILSASQEALPAI